MDTFSAYAMDSFVIPALACIKGIKLLLFSNSAITPIYPLDMLVLPRISLACDMGNIGSTPPVLAVLFVLLVLLVLLLFGKRLSCCCIVFTSLLTAASDAADPVDESLDDDSSLLVLLVVVSWKNMSLFV